MLFLVALYLYFLPILNRLCFAFQATFCVTVSRKGLSVVLGSPCLDERFLANLTEPLLGLSEFVSSIGLCC